MKILNEFLHVEVDIGIRKRINTKFFWNVGISLRISHPIIIIVTVVKFENIHIEGTRSTITKQV